jgi:probable HAF family extracellular repeat protein
MKRAFVVWRRIERRFSETSCKRLKIERIMKRMMFRWSLAVVAASALLLTAGTSPAGPPQYTVTDLGPGQAYGINASGQVVGISGGVAVVWTGTTPTALGAPLGGINSFGWAINAGGQVAGAAATAGNEYHAVRWTGTTADDLGVLGGEVYLPGYNDSGGRGINAAGQVAGSSAANDVNDHYVAVRWTGTTAEDLGTLGGYASSGYGINDSGQVSGYSLLTGNGAYRVVRWTGTTAEVLDPLGDSYDNRGFGINASGQIVGYAYAGTEIHAVRWTGTTPEDLGTLGGTMSVAYAINASGDVVGGSYTTGNVAYVVFLYTGGKMYDLNALLVPGSGVTQLTANTEYVGSDAGGNSINDLGQIAAWGVINGQTHALRLTPVVSDTDNLYVTTFHGQTIEKFTPGGVESVFVSSGLTTPLGIAFDSAGNLYVANYIYLGGTITKITPGGGSSVFASSGMNGPMGLAFDSAGNLYVANYNGGHIEKFTPDGVGSVFASGLASPDGLAFDSAGNLFVSSGNGQTIVKITPAGVASLFFSGIGNQPNEFSAVGLAFDSAGNLYSANGNFNRIEKFTPAGVISVFASTGLNSPHSLAFDSAGNLYVANTGGYSIEKFTPDGVGSVFASSVNGLNWPTGIAFTDAAGHPLLSPGGGAPANTFGGGGHNCSATITVPGTANPWLAGMPAGSPAVGGDSAPAESPVQVTGIPITPGVGLTFNATGAAGYGDGHNDPPDGNDGYAVAHYYPGAENGIADVTAPANALMGVFLDDSQPSLTAAPDGINFYARPDSRNYLTLSPGLKQPFFIGDGTNTSGTVQKVVVPAGATRLFLGTMDGYGWFNNTGAFTVIVTNPDCGGMGSESPIITGGLPDDGGIFIGTPIPGQPGFVTGTISGTGHPGCTIQLTISEPHTPFDTQTVTTTIDASGHWSFDVELEDCDPVIEIVQICDGVASAPVRRHVYVDGTPPVFTAGGPGDGISFSSGGAGGGYATIILDGSATDAGTFVSGGGVSYEWHLLGSGGSFTILGGGGSGGTLINGGSGLSISLPPGEYDFEVIVTDAAGNKLRKQCHRSVHIPPAITSGLPDDGGIDGPGEPGSPGHVRRIVTGTGHPGCTIKLTVTDADMPSDANNNRTLSTVIDLTGHWSIDLDLDDCDPVVEVIEICDGAASPSIRRHIYVDGTPPFFLDGGGPGDGVDYVGGGGTGLIVLGGGAGEETDVPGAGVGYQWFLIGGDGVTRTPIGDGTGTLKLTEGLGNYTIEEVVTDTAGNKLVKRCAHSMIKRTCSVQIPDAVVYYNESVALTGQVLDTIAQPNQIVTDAPLGFTVNGVSVANPAAYLATLTPGQYLIGATFPANAEYQSATATAKLTVLLRPTAVTTANVQVPYGTQVTLPGSLSDVRISGPLTGRPLSFKVNGQPVTNPFEELLQPGSYPIIVNYAGDSYYLPSTGTATLTILWTPGKITGGGSIDQSVRNFGFVVQTKEQGGALSFTGNLQYQDKALGYNLLATAITGIAIAPDRVHCIFTGTATMNGVTGYTFVASVEDWAEPGALKDKFRITISGPGVSYDSSTLATKGGILDQGNIQVHKPL